MMALSKIICGRHRRVIAAVALIGLSAAAPAPAGAMVCARPAEARALEMRVLQSELMVAALSCEQRAGYNAFVTRFQKALAGHGKALRQFFARQFDGKGQKQLDRFVTRVANESSQRSIGKGAAYCADADALYRAVLGLEAGQLAVFVAQQPFADAHGIEACTEKAEAQ